MSLEDFGVQSWASLREITRNDRGEVVCPVSEAPIDYSRGEIEVPVARLADADLQNALENAGVEYVRSTGYENSNEDLLFPETVGGPDAHGYSSRMVGVRAQLTDGSAWIPVRSDDLEAADDALEAAHDPTASADGGNLAGAIAGRSDVPDADSADEVAVWNTLGRMNDYLSVVDEKPGSRTLRGVLCGRCNAEIDDTGKYLELREDFRAFTYKNEAHHVEINGRAGANLPPKRRPRAVRGQVSNRRASKSRCALPRRRGSAGRTSSRRW